jgi:hypothetical protein
MSSVVVYGFVASVALGFFLIILFRHEHKKGRRFADRTRRHADFLVLQVSHSFHKGLQYVGRDALRQTFHYVFHTVLSLVLRLIKQSENGLREAIRSNKTIARNAERESATLSKLEEIALHKIASALTEEEKKAHKDKTLQGF